MAMGNALIMFPTLIPSAAFIPAAVAAATPAATATTHPAASFPLRV